MNREIVVCALHYVSLQLGYGHPYSDQENAVMQFVLGRDVFLSLPTGYGKSFSYCCLPLIFDMIRQKFSFHVVIVVSLLNALINDQVNGLNTKGVKAVHVNEGFDRCEGLGNGWDLLYNIH